MKNAHYPTEEQAQYIISQHINNKISKNKLAIETGLSWEMVDKTIRIMRCPIAGDRKDISKKIPADNEVWLRNRVQGLGSIRQVAILLGVSEDTINKRCRKFGIPINRSVSVAESNRRRTGMKLSRPKSGVSTVCGNCKKEIIIPNWRYSKSKTHFCNKKCQGEATRTSAQFWRRTSEYKKWRSDVLHRDSYKCTKCSSDKNLHAHHVVEANKDVSLRYNVDNGLTLCFSCHIKIHQQPL